MSEPSAPSASSALSPRVQPADAGDDLVDDELLVEEISIDGMCGVY